MDIKMRMVSAWLWLIRWLRIEEKTIELLKATPAEKVTAGKLYEHYGRVFLAEQVKDPVRIKYTIYTGPQMGPVTADILVKNAEGFHVAEEGTSVVYVTYNRELGEELGRCRDIRVTEEIENAPCGQCDLNQMKLPCANCDFRCTFKLVRSSVQNSTNQEAWGRMMARRISR